MFRTSSLDSQHERPFFKFDPSLRQLLLGLVGFSGYTAQAWLSPTASNLSLKHSPITKENNRILRANWLQLHMRQIGILNKVADCHRNPLDAARSTGRRDLGVGMGETSYETPSLKLLVYGYIGKLRGNQILVTTVQFQHILPSPNESPNIRRPPGQYHHLPSTNLPQSQRLTTLYTHPLAFSVSINSLVNSEISCPRTPFLKMQNPQKTPKHPFALHSNPWVMFLMALPQRLQTVL